MKITPTVGRIVWFYPDEVPMQQAAAGQPLAAIVTHVHSDTMVNLAVFSPAGGTFGVTSVDLYQGEGDRPSETYGRFCEWMPYQKGQAAKAEAQAAA